MTYEAPRSSELPETTQPVPLEQAIERVKRLEEPVSPIHSLGNIALIYIMGGATAESSVMPQTEAAAIEAMVGTVEYAETLRRSA